MRGVFGDQAIKLERRESARGPWIKLDETHRLEITKIILRLTADENL
jgi:hypothetical protein